MDIYICIGLYFHPQGWAYKIIQTSNTFTSNLTWYIYIYHNVIILRKLGRKYMAGMRVSLVESCRVWTHDIIVTIIYSSSQTSMPINMSYFSFLWEYMAYTKIATSSKIFWIPWSHFRISTPTKGISIFPYCCSIQYCQYCPHMRTPRLHWMPRGWPPIMTANVPAICFWSRGLTLATRHHILMAIFFTQSVYTLSSGYKIHVPLHMAISFSQITFFTTIFPHPRNYHIRHICQLYNQYCTLLPNSTSVLLG